MIGQNDQSKSDSRGNTEPEALPNLTMTDSKHGGHPEHPSGLLYDLERKTGMLGWKILRHTRQVILLMACERDLWDMKMMNRL